MGPHSGDGLRREKQLALRLVAELPQPLRRRTFRHIEYPLRRSGGRQEPAQDAPQHDEPAQAPPTTVARRGMRNGRVQGAGSWPRKGGFAAGMRQPASSIK
jgi:hypothetical protein